VASKEKNSSKLNFLNKILYGAIVIFIILVITYFIFNLDDEQKGNWGTFGDFIGGTLNPIFALFSLFAIIYTIKIQTEELELSREELRETKEELKESRIAQQEQSESLKLQNEATKLQIFENTFFKLFDLFNLTKNTLHLKIQLVPSGSRSEIIVNDITYSISSENIGYWEKYNGNSSKDRAIKLFLEIYGFFYYKEYDYFNIQYENLTGAYFGQIYQILKFIDESNIQNKQIYVNIFRAQFTKDELVFLFYHCLGTIGKRRFKKLVEDYELFEHIILNKSIEKQLLDYDKNAFGKNEKILKRYEELKETK
jgi:hypothetical protein